MVKVNIEGMTHWTGVWQMTHFESVICFKTLLPFREKHHDSHTFDFKQDRRSHPGLLTGSYCLLRVDLFDCPVMFFFSLSQPIRHLPSLVVLNINLVQFLIVCRENIFLWLAVGCWECLMAVGKLESWEEIKGLENLNTQSNESMTGDGNFPDQKCGLWIMCA